MKTFDEVIADMKNNVSTTKNGKQKKTFSKADFDRMGTALANEPNYQVKTVGIKNGELVSTINEPVKDFRSDVKKVLLDYGVDKQEAETIMNTYKFRSLSSLHGIASAAIVEYCKAGKKFDFPTEDDFKASFVINEVGETTKEYSTIRKPGDNTPQEKFKVKTAKHRSLKSSSKPPKWLKNKFK